jgi:hypothetical protein
LRDSIVKGQVAMTMSEEDVDAAVAPFLALLAADLAAPPQSGLDAIVAEIGEVDPDAPIEGDIALRDS